MSAAPPFFAAFLQKHGRLMAVTTILALGIWLRVDWMNRSALWCDEAESGINALTILDRGLPISEYLGIPVFENTLTEPWAGHPEYEFHDSSYSPQGLAVYHGWLPLYAMAFSQSIFGLKPDHPGEPPRVVHGVVDIPRRTVAPRAPAVVFAALCMLLTFFLASDLGGSPAGFAALTLTAFNARTVDFGYQARYYSATLLMTVLAAWCLLRLVRHGRWRDFLLLGFAEALLFHTHQFSAMVFALLAVLTLPAVIKIRSWLLKSLAGGTIAAALILPWIWFSGFLFTASSVPKAYKLFGSLTDWLTYTLERPDQLAVLAAMLFLLLMWKWMPTRLPQRLLHAINAHGKIYFALLAWLALGYAAFHLVVPAASFFYERLTLVLWTPYVLLIAMFASDLLRGFPRRKACAVVVLLMVLFLAARGRLAWLEGPSVGERPEALAEVIATLQRIPFESGTKFYATPNEHLTLTYYTGIPIQSVAPVRKSFFENAKTPMVFLESQMENMRPLREDLETAAAEAGLPLSEVKIPALQRKIWEILTIRDLRARGLPAPQPPAIPEYLGPVLEKSQLDLLAYRKKFAADLGTLPIFRGIAAERTGDFWLGFFYRFVSPDKRIGSHLNIFPLLKRADILLLPEANSILYLINPPPLSGISDGANRSE